MKTARILKSLKYQTVLLPAGTEFPSHITAVNIVVAGAERVLTPVKSTWDDFFFAEPADTMPERATQHQPNRPEL